MTVNANVRYVEWFDANMITPNSERYVLGYYNDRHIRKVRLRGDGTWSLASSGPGELRQEYAKPTHWCEFPVGPHSPDPTTGDKP